MSQRQDSEKGLPEDAGNAQLWYQAAIGMWSYYGDALWSTYNALLVANSVVIAAVGLLFASSQPLLLLRWALLGLGLLLCIMWAFITARAVELHVFWGLVAREFEERSGVFDLRSRGGRFVAGESVTLEYGSALHVRKMPWCARLLPTRWAAYAVIVIFAVIYIAVIVQPFR